MSAEFTVFAVIACALLVVCVALLVVVLVQLRSQRDQLLALRDATLVNRAVSWRAGSSAARSISASEPTPVTESSRATGPSLATQSSSTPEPALDCSARDSRAPSSRVARTDPSTARTDSPGAGADSESAENASTGPRVFTHVGVVVNPSKFEDVDSFQSTVRNTIERLSQARVSFFSTTEEDPGEGPAREAMRAGCDLVVAAGGDGTVRMVATALANSGIRMAIIPSGTGNLLARNISVPLNRPESALVGALTGHDRRVDVGWLHTGSSAREAEKADPQIFLVMAGFGADAEMIGNTDPGLKKRMGWIAYAFGGARAIFGRNREVRLCLADGSEHRHRARTVVFGNVGKLPGGIVLMHEASIDNGLLEIMVAGWRGFAGLGQAASRVLSPKLGIGKNLSTVEMFMSERATVATKKPQPVQLDGDTADAASHMIARIDAGALLLRVPEDF